ncbi:hypothetical protein B0H10DRAFT_2197890 [Mycena sp. CBHHK59/15]|nr:hypothetical protein B0H10DRAFT_2199449 [Mycena sp. CBHHK59/15]KAJ6587317.1 hypothetical protein B0H10DRAFT_2197890 [Mycena sp. CBHHK59/15]
MQNGGPVALREVLELREGNGEPSKTIERGDGRQWAGGDCEECSRDAIAGHKNDFHFSGRPIDVVVHKQMSDDVHKFLTRQATNMRFGIVVRHERAAISKTTRSSSGGSRGEEYGGSMVYNSRQKLWRWLGTASQRCRMFELTTKTVIGYKVQVTESGETSKSIHAGPNVHRFVQVKGNKDFGSRCKQLSLADELRGALCAGGADVQRAD